MNKFVSDVKQLKMKKFIKSVWQLLLVTYMLHLRYPCYAPKTGEISLFSKPKTEGFTLFSSFVEYI